MSIRSKFDHAQMDRRTTVSIAAISHVLFTKARPVRGTVTRPWEESQEGAAGSRAPGSQSSEKRKGSALSANR
ncbi:unnamed protein product [Ectocarpus sp. 12 AP-2014]